MDSWQVTGDCKVRSGAIHLKDKGSMLVSDKSYKNFEWELEWKSEQRGDAGVYFHLPDTISFSHLSAGYPEMQIIDEQDNPTHLTGALFNLEAPRYKIAKPHEFNHSRVIVKDGHVEYWLNGFRVTEFDYNGNGWAKKWRDVFGNAPHISGHGKISIAIQNSAISVKNMRIRNL
jgi:cytochrome c